jgi:hypothetical protein
MEEWIVIVYPHDHSNCDEKIIVDSLGKQRDEDCAWDASGNKYKGMGRKVMPEFELQQIIQSFTALKRTQSR